MSELIAAVERWLHDNKIDDPMVRIEITSVTIRAIHPNGYTSIAPITFQDEIGKFIANN